MIAMIMLFSNCEEKIENATFAGTVSYSPDYIDFSHNSYKCTYILWYYVQMISQVYLALVAIPTCKA